MPPKRATNASKKNLGPVNPGRVTKTTKGRKGNQPTRSPSRDPSPMDVDGLTPVHGHPPAWAECRSDLCETLPWYRAFQGGAYHHTGLCWGFLVDADTGIRSHVDDEIIITRVGGGCARDSNGKLARVKDQDNDSSVFAYLKNSMQLKHPIGMVIGDRNELLGRKLPHRYNVMAYFFITDIWYEMVGDKIGARVRFQKLDLSEHSWWAAKGSPPPLPVHQRNLDMRPEMHQCRSCSQSSYRVYNEGWMCLTPTCSEFWKIGSSAPPDNLTFHPDFLNYRTLPDPDTQPHYNLVPDLLSTLNGEDGPDSTIRIAWKGIVCPLCSKCIARRFWRGWKCTDNIASGPGNNGPSCPFQKMMKVQPMSLRAVVDDLELAPIKRAIWFEEEYAVPDIDDRTYYPHRKLTYNIPDVGSVTHFVSNRSINSRPGGPNDLFRQFQLADLGLRRFPMKQSVVAGTLTAHFAVNYGMPYKFVVSVDSKGFNEAPDEILRCLGRLTWATEQAVVTAGDPFIPPNELLVLGYFEGMKIGYHDDGEDSLGPTIASLSLGAKCTMTIRMKAKFYNGFNKSRTLLQDDPVLPGCANEDERRDLKQRLINGEITQQEYDKVRQGMVKGRCADAPVLLKMQLNHGDMVVMHGENLQQYYEHAVIPENKLRFALTARYIKPEHVDENDLRKGEFTLAPHQVYDGK